MKNKITKSILASCIALIGWSTNSIAGTGIDTNPDSAATHKVGDAFGGGIIIQISKGADGKEHGLIASAANFDKAAWSANTKLNTGSNSKADGAGNTTLCTKAGVAKTEAAGICDAFEKDGFTDWFLPSVDQLEILYKAFKVEKTPGLNFTGHLHQKIRVVQ